jgi:Transglutaminase-like superfamily
MSLLGFGLMDASIDYTVPGPLTGLDGVDSGALDPLTADPAEICRAIPHLVVQPDDARALNLPAVRFDENQIRPAGVLFNRLLALDPAPVTVPRDPRKRVVGTCRHFAVLSCALLRHRGIAARVRCGFATYFQSGYGLDHWITEYWDGDSTRWIRIDSEILGQNVLAHAHDLRRGDFLSGGEAWSAHRRGEIDASRFGVHGTQNWGAAEIRGNAVKDLAAMNKVEMLPWDEWGRMTDAYDGKTGADHDLLLDDIAEVCAADDPVAVRSLYGHNDLRVPDALIR